MADKTPVQITSGNANDDSVVHASDATLGDLSRSHAERDISRLQGAAPAYSASKTYNIGDLVTQANVTFRNITAIATPEAFTPAKWKDIDGPTIPAEIEAQGALGLIADQVVAVSAAIDWDENFFVGDATKIVDEGSGVIRLHNGAFTLRSHLALDISGGGAQFAVLEWESSANVGGPFTAIPNPDARAASYTIGNASVTTQPLASAVVDATGADVFVRAVLTASSSTTILNAASSATIVSFGTSAIAQSPLTTKGDLFTFDSSDQRLPVGVDGQFLSADSAEATGLKWITGGLSLIADETLGVQGSTFDVSFPAREFLFIVIYLEAIGGNLNAEFTFNDDSGTNYAFRREENMSTLAPETSASRVPLDPSTVDTNVNGTILVFNQAGIITSFISDTVAVDGPTASTLPATQRVKGNWHDTAQVIKLNLNTTINEFTTSSRVIVYGSKD